MEKKTAIIHIRIEPSEKSRWQEAAKQDEFECLSSWVRHLSRTRIKDQQIEAEIMIEEIKEETDERKLLALAFLNEANIKTGQITPDEYAQNAVALAEKLGFGITGKSLQKAAANRSDEN